MAPSNGPRGRRPTAIVIAAGLALAGASALGYALSTQQSAPEPAPATPTTSIASGPAPATPGTTGGTTAAQPGLPASRPVAIRIPAIGVSSVVNEVGLNPDGTVQVPQEGPHYDQPAWFSGSPTPGEIGPSVILGHIDSARGGPSVFFDLGALEPGQQVQVERADHTVTTFEIDTVKAYPKSEFPQQTVYGYTARPALRLITCGGAFDHETRQYRDNTVVFAHLLGHP